MLEQFLKSLAETRAILVRGADGGVAKFSVAGCYEEPENEIVFLSWINEPGAAMSAKLTQAGLTAAEYAPNHNTYKVEDAEGSEMFITFYPYPAPNLAPVEEKECYLVVQEGGSSTEIYFQVFETPEDADQYRDSCEQAAYLTSKPVLVAENLVLHPKFFEFVGAALSATASFDYPDEGYSNG
jgi:hypothetical protein